MRVLSILSVGILVFENNDYEFFKFGDSYDTPFYRFPKLTKEILNNIFSVESVITNKKKLFNLTKKNVENIKDLNTLLWYNDKQPVKIPDTDNIVDHLRTIKQFLSENENLDLTYPMENDIILQACNILNGKIKIGDTIYDRSFDHFTKSGRLRDKANTISLPKAKRNEYEYKYGKLAIDMIKFHLYIIDKTLNINILYDDIDPLQQFLDDGLFSNMDEAKKEVYRAIYSERFDIDHKFFNLTERKHNTLRSLLKPTEIFNYKIQQYESYLMSLLIIKNQKINPIFYLYDGIIFDTENEDLVKGIGYPYRIER